MEIPEMLDILKQRALADNRLREEFLATRKEEHPLEAFCEKCRELGYPVYEMDLISAGEDFYAGKILLCWKVKMIFMSYFLPDYKVENGGKKIEKQQEFYL